MRIQTSCSFITVFWGFKVIQGYSRLNFFSDLTNHEPYFRGPCYYTRRHSLLRIKHGGEIVCAGLPPAPRRGGLFVEKAPNSDFPLPSTGREFPVMNSRIEPLNRCLRGRSADCQICCVAGCQACVPWPLVAGGEIFSRRSRRGFSPHHLPSFQPAVHGKGGLPMGSLRSFVAVSMAVFGVRILPLTPSPRK